MKIISAGVARMEKRECSKSDRVFKGNSDWGIKGSWRGLANKP